MFLSADEIIQAVKDGDIRIAYYSITDSSGEIVDIPEKKFVRIEGSEDDDEYDRLIRKYFLESVEPDSLTFHVGPYASVENPRRWKGVANLIERGSEKILAVKKSRSLVFYPHEFCLVGTNEYIEVSDQIGASLYANVRNTDIGLSHVSTMVDPSWKGKLQIGLTNPTDYTKQLHYLDAVAILRFHRISSPASKEVLERFQIRRPHYGNDWWTIEKEEGRRFFPKRKEYSQGGSFETIIEKEKRANKAKEYLKYALGAIGVSSIVGVIFFTASLYNKIEDSSKFTERMIKAEQSIGEFEKVKEKFHVLNTGHLTIPAVDQGGATFAIPFIKEFTEKPTIFIDLDVAYPWGVVVKKEYTSINRSGKTVYTAAVVKLYLVQAKQKSIGPLDVSWLVVNPQ